MELTQTRAILSYLATKYNLHGKDPKETVRYQSACADTWFFSKLSSYRRPRSDAAFQPGGRGGDEGTRGDACATPVCLVHALNTCFWMPLLLFTAVCIRHSHILSPLLTKCVLIKWSHKLLCVKVAMTDSANIEHCVNDLLLQIMQYNMSPWSPGT